MPPKAHHWLVVWLPLGRVGISILDMHFVAYCLEFFLGAEAAPVKPHTLAHDVWLPTHYHGIGVDLPPHHKFCAQSAENEGFLDELNFKIGFQIHLASVLHVIPTLQVIRGMAGIPLTSR